MIILEILIIFTLEKFIFIEIDQFSGFNYYCLALSSKRQLLHHFIPTKFIYFVKEKKNIKRNILCATERQAKIH